MNFTGCRKSKYSKFWRLIFLSTLGRLLENWTKLFSFKINEANNISSLQTFIFSFECCKRSKLFNLDNVLFPQYQKIKFSMIYCQRWHLFALNVQREKWKTEILLSNFFLNNLSFFASSRSSAKSLLKVLYISR